MPVQGRKNGQGWHAGAKLTDLVQLSGHVSVAVLELVDVVRDLAD